MKIMQIDNQALVFKEFITLIQLKTKLWFKIKTATSPLTLIA